MSVILVSSDRIQQVAFENPGHFIHTGPHSSTLLVDGLFYVAPLDAA